MLTKLLSEFGLPWYLTSPILPIVLNGAIAYGASRFTSIPYFTLLVAVCIYLYIDMRFISGQEVSERYLVYGHSPVLTIANNILSAVLLMFILSYYLSSHKIPFTTLFITLCCIVVFNAIYMYIITTSEWVMDDHQKYLERIGGSH